MVKKSAPLFLLILFLSCHDDGVQPEAHLVVFGPHAVTNQTVYAINEPITVKISSDTSTIWVDECQGAPAYFLEFLQGPEWVMWEDNTFCLYWGAPNRIYNVGPGNVYAPTFIFPAYYPGTYRFKIPYQSIPRRRGEIVSNEFVLEE